MSLTPIGIDKKKVATRYGLKRDPQVRFYEAIINHWQSAYHQKLGGGMSSTHSTIMKILSVQVVNAPIFQWRPLNNRLPEVTSTLGNPLQSINGIVHALLRLSVYLLPIANWKPAVVIELGRRREPGPP